MGYILGYRQSSIMVSGSLISALVLTPLIALVGDGLPHAPLSRSQVADPRPHGGADLVAIHALAAAGIVTVIRAWPHGVTRPY